ncbi:MAG: SdrD B-like domain-containing protein, partial [Bacteroidota bacterium]
RSTQTNIDGSYSFTNLLPGNYRLTFSEFSSNSQKYILTFSNRGGDDTSDSDPNRLQGGQTVVETLVSGEYNTSYDGGYFSPVSVGNLVWLDRNANGVQDAAEPGIPGVIIRLLDAAGLPVTTDAEGASVTDQVTDANGNYKFTNLIPGSYRVKFTNPDVRYTLSKANQGTDDAQDCDADATTFTTHATTLATGQYDPTLDAAYYIKGRVGNLAWHDINGNGVQDAGESGLANTAVTLTGTDGFGTAAKSGTTTDANGFYTIGNIVPGSYKITFGVTPGGYTPTTVDKGGDDATDSDYGVSGQTPVFTVQSADTILTFDAGYWLATRIGSLVWDDTNGNGLQDAGEPGISGVSVILNGTEGDGDIVNLSTTTSATGEYAFGDQSSGSSNLAPGTYNLTFVLPAGGYVPTRSNDTDGTDANDSDANEATGATAFEVLTSGENNPTYDAGFYLPPSSDNYAWNDSNANGIQEVDELPLEGVSVVLT